MSSYKLALPNYGEQLERRQEFFIMFYLLIWPKWKVILGPKIWKKLIAQNCRKMILGLLAFFEQCFDSWNIGTWKPPQKTTFRIFKLTGGSQWVILCWNFVRKFLCNRFDLSLMSVKWFDWYSEIPTSAAQVVWRHTNYLEIVFWVVFRRRTFTVFVISIAYIFFVMEFHKDCFWYRNSLSERNASDISLLTDSPPPFVFKHKIVFLRIS